MLPDAHALVREVDCLLKEVESLVERLGRGFEDARAKVEALDLMRRGYAAFGTQDVSTLLAASVEPMKERVARIDARLRASLGGAAACTGESAAPAHADGMHGASGVAREAAAVSARGPEDVPAVEAQRARVVDRLHEPAPSDPPVRAGGIAGYGRGDDPHDLRAGAAASHVSEPGIGGSTILRPASRFGRPHGAGSAPIVPPDPGDLDKIRQLEDECEREFSRLHFASDEERHSVLTLAAAKARRLRMAMRDSYAVDRRLGDLIRKIVDLKRRYRLGWIDGCERSFEVHNWDSYVEQCADHLRELRVRDSARQDEARAARERASHLATEAERRGRELRAYLDTEEGRGGNEPEKLRAVLISYLAVEGPLDCDLIERLRGHRALFTGIAFRRLRKAFERQAGAPASGHEEASSDPARRERVHQRLRGHRAVLFAASPSEESRRRLELALGLDRLSWVDASNGELPGALLELGHQIARGEIHLVVRTPGSVDDAALREAIHRGAATLVDIERVDLPEAVVAAVERALVAEAGPAA